MGPLILGRESRKISYPTGQAIIFVKGDRQRNRVNQAEGSSACKCKEQCTVKIFASQSTHLLVSLPTPKDGTEGADTSPGNNPG